MYLQSIKSVKHNAAKSVVNRSILKKSRHIGFSVFLIHSSMIRSQQSSEGSALLSIPAIHLSLAHLRSRRRRRWRRPPVRSCPPGRAPPPAVPPRSSPPCPQFCASDPGPPGSGSVIICTDPDPFIIKRKKCERDLAEWLERLAANAIVATVLGSIPASSDTVDSEGRQMKQC